MKIIFTFLSIVSPFIVSAQIYNTSTQGSNNSAGGAYVAPIVTKTYGNGNNPSTVSHYSGTNGGGTVDIAVFDKKDAATIQTLAKGADITDDAYYARIIDVSNAEFVRNGVLGPTAAQWKNLVKDMIASEWPAKFPQSFSFDSGYATVKHHDSYGVIDTAGRIIIPIIWGGYASTFSSGLAYVKTAGRDGKCGFMDKTNTLVIPLKYDDCDLGFREGLACVKLDKKWGYINTYDATVIPFMYDAAAYFRGGFANVQIKKKVGVIDRTGKEIIPLKYQDIYTNTPENIFSYKYKDKWGAFDINGVTIIEPIYDNLIRFNGDKAQVSLKSRTFYIDKTGHEVPAL